MKSIFETFIHPVHGSTMKYKESLGWEVNLQASGFNVIVWEIFYADYNSIITEMESFISITEYSRV